MAESRSSRSPRSAAPTMSGRPITWKRWGSTDKVTWIGTGNVDTMLGSLKTKQVDVLVESLSVLNESEEKGWGTVIYSTERREDLEQVDRRQGAGDVAFHPAVHDRQGAGRRCRPSSRRSGARRNGSRRTRPEQIYDTIEPYVGSTSREANMLEITALQEGRRLRAMIDAAQLRARREGLVPGNDRHQAAHDCRRRQPDLRRGGAERRIPLERTDAIADAVQPDERRRAHRRQGFEQIVPARRVRRSRRCAMSPSASGAANSSRCSGPRARGKSTILNMIATLVKPSGGEILVDGKPVVAGKATPCRLRLPAGHAVSLAHRRGQYRLWAGARRRAGGRAEGARRRMRRRRPGLTASTAPIPRRCRAACASARR